MTRQQLAGGILGVALVGVTMTFAVNPASPSQSQYMPPQQTTTTPAVVYSMKDVEAHNTAQSCWTVVMGEVYDLTAWAAKHPGGKEAIQSMCGKDATVAFGAQHGGQRTPEKILGSFKIGTRAQ